jgi:hypothetical protein
MADKDSSLSYDTDYWDKNIQSVLGYDEDDDYYENNGNNGNNSTTSDRNSIANNQNSLSIFGNTAQLVAQAQAADEASYDDLAAHEPSEIPRELSENGEESSSKKRKHEEIVATMPRTAGAANNIQFQQPLDRRLSNNSGNLPNTVTNMPAPLPKSTPSSNSNTTSVNFTYSTANYSPTTSNFPQTALNKPNPFLQSSYSPNINIGSTQLSPNFGPMAAIPPNLPSLSPFISVSSPRLDAIPSISMRIEQLQRCGRAMQLMKNVAECNSGQSTLNSVQNSSKTPSYNYSAPNSSVLANSSKNALLSIDRFLRRRNIFGLLDADFIVKGIIYNKTSLGLIITITEILDKSLSSAENSEIMAENSEIVGGNLEGNSADLPRLSTLSENSYENLQDLADLCIQGECHYAEIGELAGKFPQNLTNHEISLQLSMNRSSTSGENSANTETSAGNSGFPSLDGYSIGDSVLALVISVDNFGEKVYLSMNNARIRQITTKFTLGPYKLAETEQNSTNSVVLSNNFEAPSVPYGFPLLNSAGKYKSSPAQLTKPRTKRATHNFVSNLRLSSVFKNPATLDSMIKVYNLNENGSLLGRNSFPGEEFSFKSLRFAQNQAWAKESVVKGISLAKKANYDSAMKCYNHALDIEPNFVQAFVARGACYVLQGEYDKAVKEFDQALKLDPKQPYAKDYRQACLDKLNIKNSKANNNNNSKDNSNNGSGNISASNKEENKPKSAAATASSPIIDIAGFDGFSAAQFPSLSPKSKPNLIEIVDESSESD